MSGCLFSSRPQSSSEIRATLLAAFFAAAFASGAEASALDWLNSNTKVSRPRQTKARVSADQQVVQLTGLEQKGLTGSNLDSYQFAQSHFGNSRSKLESACRAISSRYNDAAVRDILQKLFVIDTQLFKEAIKNSALAVKEILTVNDGLGQGIQDLNRIVTAPGQETLDQLDKTVDKVGAANLSQSLLVKKYMAGAERTIQLAQSAYETLELIPSLSTPGLDMMVQMSKQLMRMTQSNAEAFKGLLLNIQSSNELISSGLENIKKTVRETLRFSDHFAVKQFPLINLPAPSREKIFVQLTSLANSIKGTENTVTIGDSQVRNTAQQFTHLISGFLAKAGESLKYQSQAGVEKAPEQISTYARNQVSGLFLRVKEDISLMRTEMAKASRPNARNLPPAVNFESRDEYASRNAQRASSQKLPLFLLGNTGGSVSQTASAGNGDSRANSRSGLPNSDDLLIGGAKPSARAANASGLDGFIALNTGNRAAKKPVAPKSGTTQVLFSENSFSDDETGLMQPEMNILTKELGSDFFFGESGENQSAGSLMAQGSETDSFEEDDTGPLPDESEHGMQMSYDNLSSGGEPEIEMLKFESVSDTGDSSDLLPMMRYDSEVLDLEE
ncbi:MAG TPA: hypothetical protein PLK28_03450 [Candidatus Rifleibacterium sp.]|nr:hypothetical protein [Candidatus Rifleibacterium sp.]